MTSIALIAYLPLVGDKRHDQPPGHKLDHPDCPDPEGLLMRDDVSAFLRSPWGPGVGSHPAVEIYLAQGSDIDKISDQHPSLIVSHPA